MCKKRIMTLLIALLLVLCLSGASAEEPMFASTQAFLEMMQSSRVWCEFCGMAGDGEHVVTEASTADGEAVLIDLCFAPDGRLCTLRAPELIAFAEPQLLTVLQVCNELNSEYRYVRFCVGETDRTVTAALDVRFLPMEANDAVWEAMQRLLTIVGEAVPTLMPLSGR